MSEQSPSHDPIAAEMRANHMAQQAAADARANRAYEESVRDVWVDVTDKASYDSYEDYLAQRPGTQADADWENAKNKQHEADTLRKTGIPYEKMSDARLERELAEAKDTIGKVNGLEDRTKREAIEEILVETWGAKRLAKELADAKFREDKTKLDLVEDELDFRIGEVNDSGEGKDNLVHIIQKEVDRELERLQGEGKHSPSVAATPEQVTAAKAEQARIEAEAQAKMAEEAREAAEKARADAEAQANADATKIAEPVQDTVAQPTVDAKANTAPTAIKPELDMNVIKRYRAELEKLVTGDTSKNPEYAHGRKGAYKKQLKYLDLRIGEGDFTIEKFLAEKADLAESIRDWEALNQENTPRVSLEEKRKFAEADRTEFRKKHSVDRDGNPIPYNDKDWDLRDFRKALANAGMPGYYRKLYKKLDKYTRDEKSIYKHADDITAIKQQLRPDVDAWMDQQALAYWNEKHPEQQAKNIDRDLMYNPTSFVDLTNNIPNANPDQDKPKSRVRPVVSTVGKATSVAGKSVGFLEKSVAEGIKRSKETIKKRRDSRKADKAKVNA